MSHLAVLRVCAPPPSHPKEQADRRTVDVQSLSLIFSEGESEISLEKSLEEVKDS